MISGAMFFARGSMNFCYIESYAELSTRKRELLTAKHLLGDDLMDLKRAKEIINSKGVIEVTYNNAPVWLESVIEEDASAHVKLLSTNQSMNIPVEQLSERHPNITIR
jgi:small acid-soluble spore protein H (minor)